MEITLKQLESLLIEQKRIVIEKLRSQSYYYNAENTPGHQNSMKIDEQKFLEVGMSAKLPDDIIVLKRYISIQS